MYEDCLVAITFGLLGLGQEIIFTAFESWATNDSYCVITSKASSNRSLLLGYSSLLYFPFYCTIPFLFRFYRKLINSRYRIIVYALTYHLVEFLSMYILFLIIGTTPSYDSYIRSRYGIYGFTRLDYMPFFMTSALFLEQVYLTIN